MALLALVALLSGAMPAWAGTPTTTPRQKEISDQISSLQSQVGEASAEEANLLKEIDASSATKRSLDQKVADLDSQISATQQKLNGAQAKLDSAQAEQRGAETRLSTSQQALTDAHNRLAAYAIAAYTGQSSAVQLLTATFQAQSMDELITKRSYMKVVGSNQADLIALDERLRDEVRDLTAQLTALTQQAQAQATEVANQKAALQSDRADQDSARSQVAAEIAHADDLKAQVVARKDEFLAEQVQLQNESDAITAQLKARADAERASGGGGGSAAPATPGAKGFIAPLAGALIVTSPYGYRVHPIYGTTLLHTGVDLGADSGTPIRAAASGTVVSAGWMDGYGNATVIDHGGGLATLYGHQSALLVSAGQKVGQGETIGRVGCTGSCTGPHLHFEVRVNGSPVDPMPYIT